MIYPDTTDRDTAPQAAPDGTASGPYALTPAMLTAMTEAGNLGVRAVALSWALAGHGAGNAVIGTGLAKFVLDQARQYESYLQHG
jgi:hypothetical protein